jgi:hypothetical protein
MPRAIQDPSPGLDASILANLLVQSVVEIANQKDQEVKKRKGKMEDQ